MASATAKSRKEGKTEDLMAKNYVDHLSEEIKKRLLEKAV